MTPPLAPTLPRIPVELAFLSDHIPPEAVLAIVEAHGGNRIYFAKKSEGSELEALIGAQGAAALAKAHGGETWRVPLVKDWRVRLYHASGMSYGQIARRLGMSDTTVWRHLHHADLTASQLDLGF